MFIYDEKWKGFHGLRARKKHSFALIAKPMPLVDGSIPPKKN